MQNLKEFETLELTMATHVTLSLHPDNMIYFVFILGDEEVVLLPEY